MKKLVGVKVSAYTVILSLLSSPTYAMTHYAAKRICRADAKEEQIEKKDLAHYLDECILDIMASDEENESADQEPEHEPEKKG